MKTLNPAIAAGVTSVLADDLRDTLNEMVEGLGNISDEIEIDVAPLVTAIGVDARPFFPYVETEAGELARQALQLFAEAVITWGAAGELLEAGR